MVKNLPTMQETQVRSLGWEDPLEKEMATHSSILAWRIPWIEEPDGLNYQLTLSLCHKTDILFHHHVNIIFLMRHLLYQ